MYRSRTLDPTTHSRYRSTLGTLRDADYETRHESLRQLSQDCRTNTRDRLNASKSVVNPGSKYRRVAIAPFCTKHSAQSDRLNAAERLSTSTSELVRRFTRRRERARSARRATTRSEVVRNLKIAKFRWARETDLFFLICYNLKVRET